MSRILITSGPTRQYIDPVRYLTNASSGRMGRELARVATRNGHDVIIVSGPVSVEYPEEAEVHWVETTEEMLEACRRIFPTCEGLVGVAAPCDYRPLRVEEQKISKTGAPLVLHLEETPDVVATLGAEKEHRWVVGFALETSDHHFRAITKLERKRCDLMVLNGPRAINAEENQVEVIDSQGELLLTASGPKEQIAQQIFALIEQHLIKRRG